MSARRHIRGPNPERVQTCRPPHRATHQVRVSDQLEDCQGPRPDHPTLAPAAGGSSHRMNRRTFLCGLTLGLATPLAAEAQPPGKIARVGFLNINAPTTFDLVRQGLQDLGWIEGKTLVFEVRYARDEADKLPALAGELVRLPVDVVVTVGMAATHAAQDASTAIPIVMLVGDPIAAGFVASLARPGSNITGVALHN